MHKYILKVSCLLLVCLTTTVVSIPTLDCADEESQSQSDWAVRKQSAISDKNIFGRAYYGLTGRGYICIQGTCGFANCCHDGTEYCVVTGGKSSCVSSATVTATAITTRTIYPTTTRTAPTQFITQTVTRTSTTSVPSTSVTTIRIQTNVAASTATVLTTVGGGTATVTSFITIAPPTRRDLNKRVVTHTVTSTTTTTGDRVTASYTPYSTITTTVIYLPRVTNVIQSLHVISETSFYTSTQYQTIGGASVTKTVLSTITLPGPSTIVSTTTQPSTIISTTTEPGSISATSQAPSGDNSLSQPTSVSSTNASQTPSSGNSVSQANSGTTPARTTTPGIVLATTPASSSASSGFRSLNGCIGVTLLAVGIGYLGF